MVERDHGPPAAVARNRGVAYVGRLTEEKGVLVLAEAARRAGVPVRFVGDGPMRTRILALNPDALITGWLDEPAAIAAMREARAVVAPSLWYETGPLTVMQAAACGIGAIASASIGAAADIVPGETGLLVPAGDVGALAEALTRASGDEAVRWGGAARSRFDAMPRDLPAHTEAIARVYAGALAAAA
jgi:glycosyltransferase involved in cell wall biosynthesis